MKRCTGAVARFVSKKDAEEYCGEAGGIGLHGVANSQDVGRQGFTDGGRDFTPIRETSGGYRNRDVFSDSTIPRCGRLDNFRNAVERSRDP